jgi:limonene-1,2-epoxide hydrolase
MSQNLTDKAIAYLRHLEHRDWASARMMCSQTASVWHNDGKGDQTIEANIAGMQSQIDSIESMRYDVIRQFSQSDEVLQQHVVDLATTNGMRGQVHAAAYFRFEDGLITRIEEYANFVPTTDNAA